MGDLREWFTQKIQDLGFAGLEGVYDYLSTMPDDEASQYLHSLMGAGPRVQDFADVYVRSRAAGGVLQSGAASSSAAGGDPSLTSWAAAGSSTQSKKSKKGRGKSRTTGPRGGNLRQNEKATKPSFAAATSSRKPDVQRSAQSAAITNAPVEQARQKIRDYRKSKKPINCMRCGKIESPIKEDGACSFCQAPIFPIQGTKQPTPNSKVSSRSSSQERHGIRERSRRPSPEVLGRYVFLAGENGGVEDLSGKFLDGGRGAADIPSERADASLAGSYQNPQVYEKDIEETIASVQKSLRLVTDRQEGGCDLLPRRVQGRLQIDALSPSARPRGFDIKSN